MATGFHPKNKAITMLKNFLLCCCIGTATLAFAHQPLLPDQDSYKLTIKFNDVKTGKVFMMNKAGDTMNIVNGVAHFNGKLKVPEMTRFVITSSELDRPFLTDIFLENSNISVEVFEQGAQKKVTGSAVQDELLAIQNNFPGQRKIDSIGRVLEKLYSSKEPDARQKMNELDVAYRQANAAKTAYYKQEIRNRPNSQAMSYIISRLSVTLPLPELEALVAEFSKDMEGVYIDYMRNFIARAHKLENGAVAPDFAMEKLEGGQMSLSDLRGKYVLVDFWATWCGPCMRELPEIKAIYNQFHNKNFEILGVSLDTDGDKWRRIVKEKEMVWPHVSDLKGWENEAGKLYNVKAVPNNFLLDPEGKIIGRDLHGARLQQALEGLMQNASN